MDKLDFLSNVLRDFCQLNDLPYLSASDLLYESDNHDKAICYNKLTSEQEDWLSCYINIWDIVVDLED